MKSIKTKAYIKLINLIIFSMLIIGGVILLANASDLFSSSKVYASTSRTVTIEPKDFLKYFNRNGSAANFDYDTSSYTQTLTPDEVNQSGNVTLKSKIDMSQDFDFKGKINLGDKSKENMGADGIGILFQPGDTNLVGEKGGGAGIGGVKGAFGFKLDTWNNEDDTETYGPDPANLVGHSFGSFVDGTSGKAITIPETAKIIPQPNKNNFVDFKMSYSGSTKVMKVTYGDQSWEYNVSSMIGKNKTMSFAVSASTGIATNLQQLRNVNFSYTVAQGNVLANYVDESGNKIADSVAQSGDIGTSYTTEQKNIPGYTFKEVKGDPTKGKYTADDQEVTYIYTRNKCTADVAYIDDTNNKTLSTKKLAGKFGDKDEYRTTETIKNYEDQGYELVSDNYPKDGVIYKDENQHFEVHLTHKMINNKNSKIVNEIIHYVYRNGSQAHTDYVATPVKFECNVSTDMVTGAKVYGDWSPAEQSFIAVDSPDIKGYTPDKKQIGKQTVNVNSNDLEFTVVYTKSSVPPVPIDPIEPINGKIIVKYQDTEGNELSDEIIKSGKVGEGYTTDKKVIDGYTFKEVQGNTTGKFIDKTQIIIYIYTKKPDKPVNPIIPVDPDKPDKSTPNNPEKPNKPVTPNTSQRKVVPTNPEKNKGKNNLPLTAAQKRQLKNVVYGLTAMAGLFMIGEWLLRRKNN